jgi:hypothetical protein
MAAYYQKGPSRLPIPRLQDPGTFKGLSMRVMLGRSLIALVDTQAGGEVYSQPFSLGYSFAA